MRKKKIVDLAQNLTLLLLTASALFLLTRLPLFRGGLALRFQELLSSGPAETAQDAADHLGGVFPSVHLVLTDESEYGRCVRLYVEEGDPLLRQSIPLFQEALGSATEVGATAERTLRQALDTASLYLDLTVELPLSVVAAWLGEQTAFERGVRALALSAGEGDTATLYLRSGNGDVFRYYTALPVSAILTLCQTYPPNGGSFAYESGYTALAPYTILPAETGMLGSVQSVLPAGASTYNLLTALDFNAHTLSRYTESGGVEVVEESPRTLRISPDGTVGFVSRGDTALPLYQVSAAGDTPTAAEAVRAAMTLAEALTEGTGASGLYLRAAEQTEDGWQIRFRYQVDGVPVRFSDEEDALTVTVAGTAITAFTYRCRTYLELDDLSMLLPAFMAAAIAEHRAESGERGGGLSIGYVDGGPGQLSAQWLPGSFS